jgi:hypothetical protein
MTAESQLRGWPIYFNEDADEWRFVDTDEPTVTTLAKRPCGHCGQHGSSNDGHADPCLGELPGVTNACCGHGDPSMAYICFMGGLTIRGFEVEEFHHRHMTEEELKLIHKHNDDRAKFRTMRPSEQEID